MSAPPLDLRSLLRWAGQMGLRAVAALLCLAALATALIAIGLVMPAGVADCRDDAGNGLADLARVTTECSASTVPPTATAGSVSGSADPLTSMRVEVTRTGETTWSARAVMHLVLPVADPLVAEVRRGDGARDPDAFAQRVAGTVVVGGRIVSWAAPVLTSDATSTAAVDLAGDAALDPNVIADGRPVTVDVLPRRPSGIEVSSPALARTAIAVPNGGLVREREDPHTLVGRFDDVRGSFLHVSFSADPRVPVPERQSVGPAWSAAGRALASSAFGVLPWVVVLIVTGHLVGARVRTFVVAATGLLVGHLVLLGIQLTALPSSFVSGPRPEGLVTWLHERGIVLSGGAVTGTSLLQLTSLLVAVALFTRRFGGRPLSTRSRLLLAGGFLLAVVAAVAVYLWLAAADRSRDYAITAPGPLLAVVAGATAILLLVAAGLARSVGAPLRPTIVAAAFAVPLTVLGQAADRGGALPGLLRLGLPVLAVTVACSALVVLARDAAAPSTRRDGRPRIPGPFLFVLVGIAAAPWGLGNYEVPWTWSGLGISASRTDGVLVVAFLVVVVAGFRAAGLQPATDTWAVHRMWRCAIAVAVPVLAVQFTLARPPAPTLLIVSVVGAFLLFPRSAVTTERRRLQVPSALRDRAVDGVVEAGEARRYGRAMRKKLEEKVADGSDDVAGARAQLRAVDAAGRPDEVRGLSAYTVAFGGGVSDAPWTRARRGALGGTLLGLPWTAFALWGAVDQLPLDDVYPVLSLVTSLLPLVLRWTAYGALAGYFFPLIRGTTGFGKSVTLFVASGLPAAAEAVVNHSDLTGWQSTVLALVQLAAFWAVLGIVADAAILRRRGRAVRSLVDVHNLGSVAAFGSTALLAGGTAIVTAVLAGVTPFVTGVVAPGAVPTPAEQGSQKSATTADGPATPTAVPR